MGGIFSRKKKNRDKSAGLVGSHIAKQNVTLWTYANNGNTLVPTQISKGDLVQVVSANPKWWLVRAGAQQVCEGYAAKHYFADKDESEEYKKEPWYFGDMERQEAVELLGDTANPDGSFLVRHSPSKNLDVLCLKYFNSRPEPGSPEEYCYKNYDVKSVQGEVWFSSRSKFPTLPELIRYCMDNKADGVVTKLTNVCLIPNPHSDPMFEFHSQEHDSLRVPFSEISLGPPIGVGNFGKVFKARFRGNLDVAVKQLKVKDEKVGKKAIEEFFTEISTMRELNHPNLIQLFAFITSAKEGNFMIQELMENGDLKSWLQELKRTKKTQQELAKDSQLWSRLLAWCVEIARGMERLESLGIVHRDLAARNILLDKFNRAKVADFGLALQGEVKVKADSLPVKWTAPEALFEQEFSSMSDAWSFGILMFELLTVGENPYHYNRPKVTNKDYKEQIRQELRTYRDSGKKPWVADCLRCIQPDDMMDCFNLTQAQSDPVVKMMESCWDVEPKERPKFKRLVVNLEQSVNDYDYEPESQFNTIGRQKKD